MSRILLSTINAKWIHPSLALRLLKANLDEFEHDAVILEFALRQPLEQKLTGILDACPEILGLSVSIWNHEATLELLDALAPHWQAAGRRPIVILGGPEVSNLDSGTPLLSRCDFLIKGEGEVAFRDLCVSLLTHPRTSPCESPKPFPIQPKVIEGGKVSLDTIDPGYRLYTDEDLQRKLTYVEATRGCPFGCEFCLSSLDRTVRDFPLPHFLEQMEDLISRGARDFKFLDRSFNLDISRACSILTFFLDHLVPGLCVHFELVPSRITQPLRELLARFPGGSLRLEIGIQTLNGEVAERIGRQSNPELELEALNYLHEKTNAIVHADLIGGLPGEDLASFGRGLDALWASRPGEIQLGILKCLPGTSIARHTTPFSMVYTKEPPYEVQSTSAIPQADMDRLKNLARFWELIVNRGHFTELIPYILPEEKSVFIRFLSLSDFLLARLGRNWGIDRSELRASINVWLEDYSQQKSPDRYASSSTLIGIR